MLPPEVAHAIGAAITVLTLIGFPIVVAVGLVKSHRIERAKRIWAEEHPDDEGSESTAATT